MSTASSDSDRILVLLPAGLDTEPTVQALSDTGLHVDLCASTDDLVRKVDAGAGAVLIADEALGPPDVSSLVDAVRRQPAWSDVPVLVLTRNHDPIEANATAVRLVEDVANVTLLERPVRAVTLLSTIRSALRARRRQYEVRDHLEERRRAEAERDDLLARERAARADVEAANRAKDEFLAVLSHELRTPLQPILGWVKLLRQRPADLTTLRRGLETIERNAGAQAQIVEELLDISRVIAGKLRLDVRPVSLVPIVEAAVDAVREAGDAKQIALELSCAAGDTVVLGDTYRLQQVIWNVVANAVAFTPAGGRVQVSLATDDGRAIVTVSDTGQGIPPEFLPHIFERFRQADSTSTRRHGGLGLGLAIVRHLVELHGGQVRAESAGEGKGATFVVMLPLAAQPLAMHAGPPRPVAEADELTLTGRRVLVVDDDPDTCDLLSTALGYYGAQVTTAASAEEALRAVEREAPDVVVSDISMPGIDGYELVRRLRALGAERGWSMAALALTAHARASDSELAFLAGFNGYLSKPVEPAELALSIARLGRRPPPPDSLSHADRHH